MALSLGSFSMSLSLSPSPFFSCYSCPFFYSEGSLSCQSQELQGCRCDEKLKRCNACHVREAIFEAKIQGKIIKLLQRNGTGLGLFVVVGSVWDISNIIRLQHIEPTTSFTVSPPNLTGHVYTQTYVHLFGTSWGKDRQTKIIVLGMLTRGCDLYCWLSPFSSQS